MEVEFSKSRGRAGGEEPVLTPSEEARLIERAKLGDLDAFESLIGQYERKAYNLAYRLVGNHEDASDITQEAFLRVYCRLADFRGEASFSTWLFRIIQNACKDELRRRKRHNIAYLDQPVDNFGDDLLRQVPDEAEPSPEDTLEQVERQVAIQKGIDGLDEHYRLVILLRDVQGFSYNEIAEITGENLGTVKSRLNRARNALKEYLSSVELFASSFVIESRRRQRR